MYIEEHEAITENDEQLIKLMISQPSLTTSQIEKLLEVSKQAVSSRRKKLEDEGVIQNYVFWNISSKQEITKAFEINVKGVLNSQVFIIYW
ncbi:MAG: winged helix-turn-helix transcriptional regulator [candidate division WOR-3 bacterium]